MARSIQCRLGVILFVVTSFCLKSTEVRSLVSITLSMTLYNYQIYKRAVDPKKTAKYKQNGAERCGGEGGLAASRQPRW